MDACERVGKIHAYSVIPDQKQVGTFKNNSPPYRRFLNEHVAIETQTGFRTGRLKEIISEGVVLSPYAHRRLDNGKLEWREKQALFIAQNQINSVYPVSLEEIMNSIHACNKKIDEQQTTGPKQLELPLQSGESGQTRH